MFFNVYNWEILFRVGGLEKVFLRMFKLKFKGVFNEVKFRGKSSIGRGSSMC